MKRKTLITLGIAYLVLVAIVLAVGLRINKTRITPTAMSGTVISAAEETSVLGGASPTTGDMGSPTAALTGVDTTPTQHSPLLTSTALVTQLLTEPTFTQTSRPNMTRTATQGAYPISGNSTATQPPYPVEESPTSTPNPGVTPTRTKTPTYTPTSTSNQTSTPQTGWGGEWTIYWENENGIYVSQTMVVTLNGDEISANVSMNNFTYDLEGKIIKDIDVIEGQWESETSSGLFFWMLGIDNTFGGNWNNQFGFCGARPGYNQPQNCKIIREIR